MSLVEKQMKDSAVSWLMLMQWFPDGNIYGSFPLIVLDTNVHTRLRQDACQLPLPHGGRDV